MFSHILPQEIPPFRVLLMVVKTFPGSCSRAQKKNTLNWTELESNSILFALFPKLLLMTVCVCGFAPAEQTLFLV